MNSITLRIFLTAYTVSLSLSTSGGLAGAAPVPTEGGWIRVSDGTIAVYTQSSPAPAAALIHSLSQLRSSLSQASGFQVNEKATVKVIALHSAEEFDQYRLNAGACAFYQKTNRAEYIVLQDLDAGHRELFAHEFTHFVLAHSGLTLPLWLNEGLADFYSTFQIAGDRVTFGRSVAGRQSVLRSSAWLALPDLFDISTGSSYYSNPEKMALFYSESWALTHMLVTSPAYAAGFSTFLRLLNQTHSTADSLQVAYGKDAHQIQSDLHDYLDQPYLPLIEARFVSDPEAAAFPAIARVSASEMDVELADLVPNNSHAQAGMQNRLASAATRLPDDSEAEGALGFLAMQQGKLTEARAHFQLAVDRHSSDPNVLFYLGHLKHEAGVRSTEVMPLLEQALFLNPELSDARLELAIVAAADGNYEKALAALKKITALRPENAYASAFTEAYCYVHLGKFTEARELAYQAQKLAANSSDQAKVFQMLDFISQHS